VGAPAGVQLFQGCTGFRLPFGLDPLPILSAVFYRGLTVGGRTFPDWKRQPVPANQPVMPGAATEPAHPAVGVFEKLQFDVATAQLPPGAEAVLADGPGDGSYHGEAPRLFGRLLGSATFWLPVPLLLLWIWNGRRERRKVNGRKAAWIRGLIAVVVIYLVVLATATVVYAAF
jgi:hypothetical protein